eukprot:scaffold97625_cov51-Cyclotella_meneghiniana.AAC.1
MFIATYKCVNDCGHKASTTTEVYDYFFARAAAPKAIAKDLSLKAPPKATNNPYQKPTNNSQQTPLLNSRDYHAVLSAALPSLKKYMDAGGFYWIDPMGGTVLLKPYVFINLGDSAGHNENVAKKQHSKNMFPPACQPLKYKDISSVQSSRELFDLARRNRLISIEDLSHAYDNQKYADSISYYSKVDVGWNDLLFTLRGPPKAIPRRGEYQNRTRCHKKYIGATSEIDV